MTVHDHTCPKKTERHSDAARRLSYAYNTHYLSMGDRLETAGRWFAARLTDGSTNGTLYDTKRDAVRHTDEKYHVYVCVKPTSMSPCEAEAYLSLHRKLYDRGVRLADPEHHAGGPEVIRRLSAEDQNALAYRLRARNLILPT